jgi:hypothetical protein
VRPHTGEVLSVLPMDHDIEKLVKFLPPKARSAPRQVA